MAKETVTVITVGAPANMRTNHGYTPAKLGKKEPVAEKFAQMKKTLGRQGKMLVEDYEQGLYGPYDLTERDILLRGEVLPSLADEQITQLVNQSAEKDRLIAEMQAKLDALQSKEAVAEAAGTRVAAPGSEKAEKQKEADVKPAESTKESKKGGEK